MIRHFPEVNVAQPTVETLVNPRTLPEAGFQSYEMLKSDAVAKKSAFLTGEIRNPDLNHPYLHSLGTMDQGILHLHNAIEQVRRIEPDEEKAGIIATSLEFRMAEMEYIKLLGQLEFLVKEDGAEEDIRELAAQGRELGEHLYGVPDQTIRDAALGEVWSQLDAKQLSLSARKLWRELDQGFEWGGVKVAALPRPELHDALPDFNHPSLAWAGEIVHEANADTEALFRKWWSSKVGEHGEDFVAAPEDIVEAFELAFQQIDPENTSGVGVVLDPEATALSWESPLMAIKVGGKRAPITSAEALFQKWLHEGKGHGGRAINGLKTGLPVLGTGLYTDTERADYLTFEEGFCTTIEEAVSGTEPVWNGANLGHYINIALVQENGGDFRSTFETAWRYRILMKVKDNQEVTDEMIKKEQGITYTALVRIFRGTPTTLSEKYPDIAPLTFNKDLAYLNGRVLAMNHIKELYETDDEAGLLRLFSAKYDPTIPEQQAIIDKYILTAKS